MRRLLLLGCALAALALGAPARADGVKTVFDGPPVAAGALIDSGLVNVGGVAQITCVADNTAGGVARNLVAIWYADDKTTVLYTSTTSVTNATQGAIVIGLGATSATGITPVPLPPSRWMKFQLAAAGAGAGHLACFGR
jgi:hypothetical protein